MRLEQSVESKRGPAVCEMSCSSGLTLSRDMDLRKGGQQALGLPFVQRRAVGCGHREELAQLRQVSRWYKSSMEKREEGTGTHNCAHNNSLTLNPPEDSTGDACKSWQVRVGGGGSGEAQGVLCQLVFENSGPLLLEQFFLRDQKHTFWTNCVGAG